MNLLDRFTPNKISNVVGNKVAISELPKAIEKLLSLNNNELSEQIICLLGPTGSGKTLIAKLVLESINSEVLEITRHNNTNKELNNLLHNFVNNTRVDSFFTNKKKIILIDSIDILIHTEKNIVSLIEQNLSMLKKRKIPIIITCKIHQEKKLLDLKKYIVWIKVYYPNINELFPILSQFLEDCKYDYDDEKLLKIIKSNRCNIREIILNLCSSENEIQCKENETRFRNLNNFEIVQLLLKNNYNLDAVSALIKDDINMISYILYENLPDELVNNRDYNKKQKEKMLLKDYEMINQYYTHSSVFENYMFTNTDWSLGFYVNYFKLRGVNAILTNTNEKKRRKNITLRFSQILSKISHKNILNKKINSIITENSLDYLEILSIINSMTGKYHAEAGKMVPKFKKMGLNTDEMNLINTYFKYFSKD